MCAARSPCSGPARQSVSRRAAVCLREHRADGAGIDRTGRGPGWLPPGRCLEPDVDGRKLSLRRRASANSSPHDDRGRRAARKPRYSTGHHRRQADRRDNASASTFMLSSGKLLFPIILQGGRGRLTRTGRTACLLGSPGSARSAIIGRTIAPWGSLCRHPSGSCCVLRRIVVVLRQPSWWTASHLLPIFATMLSALALCPCLGGGAAQPARPTDEAGEKAKRGAVGDLLP